MEKCESCVFYPPSSFGGKPCSFCDTSNPYMNCYSRRKDIGYTYANKLKEIDVDEMAQLIVDIVKDVSCTEISYKAVMIRLLSFTEE